MQIEFIDNSRRLEETVPRFYASGEIAVDLEFDKNRYRYGFNLCLVQIYTGVNRCYLIDPLSERLDISLLFPVLESRQIQKVVFAFGEDLRLLHANGCFPVNLCDTSIAAALLNYPPQSLSNLLQETLGLEPEKSSQRSNWYNRPLTVDQQQYACNDVLYLLDLKNNLLEEAASRGVSDWIEEENRVIETLNFADQDDNEFIKEKDKKGLNEVEWHLFKKVMEFRESEAKKFNRPGYQIMDKRLVFKLIRNHLLINEWPDQKGIYRPLRNRKTANIIEAILTSAHNEIQELGLSSDRPADRQSKNRVPDKRRKEFRRADQIKRAILLPVKSMIEEEYGRDTANFILSNRIMNDCLFGSYELESYKKELVLTYAEKLKLDPGRFPELNLITNSSP